MAELSGLAPWVKNLSGPYKMQKKKTGPAAHVKTNTSGRMT